MHVRGKTGARQFIWALALVALAAEGPDATVNVLHKKWGLTRKALTAARDSQRQHAIGGAESQLLAAAGMPPLQRRITIIATAEAKQAAIKFREQNTSQPVHSACSHRVGECRWWGQEARTSHILAIVSPPTSPSCTCA